MKVRYYKGLQVRDGVRRTPLGQFTRLWRARSGLTLVEAQDTLGMHQNTVANYERNPKSLQRDHARLLELYGAPRGQVIGVLLMRQEEKRDGELLDFLEARGATPQKRSRQ